MKKRTVALSLLLTGSLLLSACDKVKSVLPSEPRTISSEEIQSGDKIIPKNVIQIGDTFEYYPLKATGHFLCTVTGAWLVTEKADCPPLDKFSLDVLASYGEDGETIHRYDDWFTENGAIDRGCMLVMVDLTVTNVDAEAVVTHDAGSFTSSSGFYLDPYAFYSYDLGDLINTTNYFVSENLEGKKEYYFDRNPGRYFSRLGEFSETDIPESLGYEQFAIKVLPGETVSFTFGYTMDTNYDGTTQPLSEMMFCVACNADPERGTFVDLKLGEETPNQE